MKGGEYLKVKIFSTTDYDYRNIEKEVNEFIADKKVIDIKPTESITNNDKKEHVYSTYTLTILYEDGGASYPIASLV